MMIYLVQLIDKSIIGSVSDVEPESFADQLQSGLTFLTPLNNKNAQRNAPEKKLLPGEQKARATPERSLSWC